MKGFKRIKKPKPLKLDFVPEPGKVYVINVRHDDGCRFWQSDDFNDCNCKPDVEHVEVTDDNLAQVASDYDKDEQAAERLRQLAKRRN